MDLVPQQHENELSGHARSEEVVPVIVHRELGFNIAEEVDHKACEAASGPCELSVAKAGVAQDGLQVQIVDRHQLFLARVVHVGQLHIGCEARRNLVAPNSCRWIHRSHDCDPLHLHEVEVCVVETLVADDLLQERNQLNRVVLVWPWQIDVLKVDDEALTLLWSVDATLRVGGLRAHRVQFLNHRHG